MPPLGMLKMADELDEAVSRARKHLRSAWTEGVEAAQALFEAAGIASERAEPTSGRATRPPAPPPAAPPESDPFGTGLDDLVSALRRGGLLQPPRALMQSLSEALEHEIRRWETRSRSDPEARLVLRAFLVLRELSWELGTSHRTPDAGREGGQAGGRAAAPQTDPAARPTAGESASPRPAARRRAQRRPGSARDPAATAARMPRVQRFEVEQG